MNSSYINLVTNRFEIRNNSFTFSLWGQLCTMIFITDLITTIQMYNRTGNTWKC